MGRLSTNHAAWIKRLAKSMPFYKHLGMTLTRVSLGRAEMQLKVTRKLTQDTGAAHGGAVTSLIDSVVGLALCTMIAPKDIITTVELKVNFIAPAKPGLLKAQGRILHKGKRIAVGDAEVKNIRGRLVAKGIVTYMILGNNGQRVLNIS